MNQGTIRPLSIYFCGSEQCAPGHDFGPAVRPHYLIHIVASGRGIYRRDGRTYRLRAGDAFLISPMESTYYQADGREPWRYLWVGFDGAMVRDILRQTCFAESCVYRAPEHPERAARQLALAEAVLAAFRASGESPVVLAGLFLQLLGGMRPDAAQPEAVAPRRYLEQAKAYLDNNYPYRIRISDVAAHVGIDRTYLYRIFMEQERCSPKQYLLRLRIRTAAGMLSRTDYTITEIAYSCGFKDASGFCNDFRRCMGMTPRQFRNGLDKTAAETGKEGAR